MDLEATIRRQREVIQTLTGLITELMFHMNADDFPTKTLGFLHEGKPFFLHPKLNEEERIELRDRVEETVNRFIEEGFIDTDLPPWGDN